MTTRSLPLSLAACLGTLIAGTVACKTDGGGDTSAASTGAATDANTSSASQATDDPGTTAATSEGPTTDGPTSEGPTTDGPTTDGPTTATPTAPTSATTDGPTTDPGTTDASASDTTAPAPTDGPGVLPGETGIDSFCRRYVECGGTYYAGEQACLDETFNYWGECPTRRAALDAFGGCMSELDCSEWNPDAYNPGSTPCAQQWTDLNNSQAC